MARQRILVPYGFTAYDNKAVDFVVDTYAHRNDVKITLFSTYAPLPEIDMDGSPVLYKIRNGMAYLAEDIEQRETGLKSIKEYLLEEGLADDQVDYIFKQREKPILEEILSLVSRGRYKVLVLSRQPGKATRLFARSLHEKMVQALKDITICIAT